MEVAEHHSLFRARWTIGLVLAIVAGTLMCAVVLIGLSKIPASRASAIMSDNVQSAASLAPSAFLYRLEPASGTFITIALPLNSRPSDVSVVSDTLLYHIWFTEPGLMRLGQVVYTSSAEYVLTEYTVPGAPRDLAASATEVWFTLPASDQVGRLDVDSGVITTITLSPDHSDLADIVLDTEGRAWVTQRAADQIVVTTISPTNVITPYLIPARGSKPGGLTIDHHGDVWVAATATGYVWRLNPLDGTFQASPSLGSSSRPDRLAHDSRGEHVWAALVNANQLAQLPTAPLMSVSFYTIPAANSQPGTIGLDTLDRVYFVQQATNRLGQLIITPTTQFVDYSLPQADLKLTSLAVAPDDAVWAVAYRDVHQLFVPLLMRNYDEFIPPIGIQMYGSLGPSNGFTRVVESKASWVRTQALWADIEPVNTTPDQYQWSALDASLQATFDANVNVLVTIDDNPAWASPYRSGPVTNVADLQEFVGALVVRYPQVKYWEFYNEPDRVGRFGLNGIAYAQMLQAIYPNVKAANATAQVVMGGLALDNFIEEGGPFDRNFLPDVLAHCAGTCFDVANFHYYPFYRWRWEPYGHDLIGKANYVWQVLAAYNYIRPLIDSETGWPSATNWGSPELQARYVPKVYARSYAAGLPLAIWYAMIDADSGNPGLLDPSLTPRPAYVALQTATSLLSPARFVRTIPATETGSPNLEGYQFSAPGLSGRKRLDVYWYDCPSMSSGLPPVDCDDVAPLRLAATRVAKLDKLGTRLIVDDTDDGYRDGFVTLGVLSSPIYIDYEP